MVFYEVSREVGKAVARMIALALGLDANFFDKPDTLGEPIAIVRPLHYQDKISDPSQGLYAAGAHTDYLLATDGVQGLQICKNKDAEPQIWEDVTPLKGSVLMVL
ncbi:2-oxoglutarate (2OG) and Fe(II)-dependent oxygenase superfamily protein [Trifolium repens]|nr:2-oxoglutarate (2OG) and Fe(II)-dependent oxygenase superfamily protein [Trifolium repens]